MPCAVAVAGKSLGAVSWCAATTQYVICVCATYYYVLCTRPVQRRLAATACWLQNVIRPGADTTRWMLYATVDAQWLLHASGKIKVQIPQVLLLLHPPSPAGESAYTCFVSWLNQNKASTRIVGWLLMGSFDNNGFL